MKIRLSEITRERESVIGLGEVRGEWLVIPNSRRRDYERVFRKVRGLGDLVEVFAKPIARAIGIEHCAGCERRKEYLNSLTNRIS